MKAHYINFATKSLFNNFAHTFFVKTSNKLAITAGFLFWNL